MKETRFSQADASDVATALVALPTTMRTYVALRIRIQPTLHINHHAF